MRCCLDGVWREKLSVGSLARKQIDAWGALFGESLGRILVSVKSEDCEAFESSMEGHACYDLGTVKDGDNISVNNGGDSIFSSSMSNLRSAWKGTLDGGGPQ